MTDGLNDSCFHYVALGIDGHLDDHVTLQPGRKLRA